MLKCATVGQVISQRNEEARMVLAELRRESSIERALNSEQMFKVAQHIGQQTLHKLLCFLIKCFQDSLKITSQTNEMSAGEIFEAADMLMGMGNGGFGRESVFDVIEAFNHFKRHPFDLYNAFNDVRLRRIMTEYLAERADWLERYNAKAGEEACRKAPLTAEQVQRDYELSKNGQLTFPQQQQSEIEQQRKRAKAAAMVENFRLVPENWPIEDTPFEDVSATQPSTDQPA